MADDSTMQRTRIVAVLSLLIFGLLIVTLVRQEQPPAAVPATAPLMEFSSGRALQHLRAVARAPHPTGSAENDVVRTYIQEQMQALGLETQVQVTTVVRGGMRRRGPAVAAEVKNLVARLPGTAAGKAVMLATHHDSVPTGPGASDDGSGVVTLIETARALRASPGLMNDVIFLFTDAEELGLLGARAFVDEHPWARRVGLVVNFEARGTSGPAAMFETSAGNAWLIREFAKVVPHPVASSFIYDFYRRMPNDTDLTVFKGAGLSGLNISYAGDWPRYHTAGDSVANLDERSLQHDGTYALSLARHFGNLDLSRTSTEDAVYFNALGKMWAYPSTWIPWLAAFAAVLFLVVAVLGFKRGRLSWGALALGASGCLAAAVLSAALAQLAWIALRSTSLASMLPYGMAYNSEWYAAGFTVLAVAVTAAVGVWLRKRQCAEGLAAGMLFWWLLGTVLTAAYAPGGSYLFVWPLLSGSLALGCVMLFGSGGSSGRLAQAWALPAAVCMLLFAPVTFMLLMFLSTSGLIPLTVSAVLLSGFLFPWLTVMAEAWKWRLPGALLLLALALMAVAAGRSGYDVRHPRATGLFYYLDGDKGEAFFVSTDRDVNSWTKSFLQNGLERTNLRRFTPLDAPALASRAPLAQIEAPVLSVMQDVCLGDLRILQLRAAPALRARALWISADRCRVLAATVGGKEIARPPSASDETGWGLYYVGLPENGPILSLVVRRTDNPVIRIVAQFDGFPAFVETSFPPRPDYFMPSPTLMFDSATLVSRTHPIPAVRP